MSMRNLLKTFSSKDATPGSGKMEPLRKVSSQTAAGAAAMVRKIQEERAEYDVVQLKTFTRWWNNWLLPRGTRITDLIEDVKSGVNGIHLLEALSGPVHSRYNKKPMNQYMELENLVVFINQIKAKGLRLVNIGPTDLHGGNRKLILGLTWTLILRYEIQKYGTDEADLLKWAKEVTEGYDGVCISNWTDSFCDGKAFCAILHSFSASCIDYGAARKKKPIPCLETAFEVADRVFGVFALLDAADLATPAKGAERKILIDERSIITYVAKLRQACIALRELEAAAMAEAAAAKAREEHAAELTQTSDKMADLAALADKVRVWCNQKEETFISATNSKELKEGLETYALTLRQTQLQEYRREDKPPKSDDKAACAQLYALVLARIRDDAVRASETPGLDYVTDEYDAESAANEKIATLGASSPAELQGVWAAMEKAEYAYEDALVARLAAIELEVSCKQTDEMANPCLKDAEALSEWITSKTSEMSESCKPSQIGQTAAEACTMSEDLGTWAGPGGEKEKKREEKMRVQDVLREVDVRRAQERRSALPPHGTNIEKSWAEMEVAYAKLMAALQERQKQLERQEAMAATDKKAAECDAQASKWKEEVDGEAGKLREAVAGELCSSIEEAEKLLATYRSETVGKKKPAWVAEKAKIESKHSEIDTCRQAEGRDANCWKPTSTEMSDTWKSFLAASTAYEQALLEKQGAMQAAEAERLRRAALYEKGCASLLELLPPMYRRAKTVDEAIAAAAVVAGEAEACLLPWIEKTTQALENQMPKGGRYRESMSGALEGKSAQGEASPAAIAQATALLSEYADVGRPPNAKARWELIAAVNQARAMVETQRYKGTPIAPHTEATAKKNRKSLDAEVAKSSPVVMTKCDGVLEQVTMAWQRLEVAETTLRAELWRLRCEMIDPSGLWERLRRGCLRVIEWYRKQATLKLVEVTACSESEAKGWLQAAQAVQAELVVQVAFVKELKAIEEKIVTNHPQYAARATKAIKTTIVVTNAVTPLERRIVNLAEEVRRQQRLAEEALKFGGLVGTFKVTVEQAEEILSFPVDVLDTPKTLLELQERGVKQSTALSPPPEGATPEQVSEADHLRARWAEKVAELTMRVSSVEQRLRAKVKCQPMLVDLAKTTTHLCEWFTRCSDLLVLRAAEDETCLNLSDVKRALEVAESQAAEGDGHARRIAELRRQIDSLGMADPPLAETVLEVSEEESPDAIAHIKMLTKQLRACVAGAPSHMDPAAVVEAMQQVEEGGGGSPITVKQIDGCLSATLSSFLVAHLPMGGKTLGSGEKTLMCTAFDPFPLDRAARAARPLPEKSIDTLTHGIAVIEHLNRARTDPAGYASELKHSMAGCYTGTTLSAPWGGRYQTAEGEAALTDLIAYLERSVALPPLKLVPQVCQAAQVLADVLSRDKEEGEGKGGKMGAGDEHTLESRLKELGKWSGTACEAVVMGVRAPDAIIAQMLLCDGDPNRQFRQFLLNSEVTVGGFGLAEHPVHGSAGTLTLLELFATSLREERVVTCSDGVMSPEFLEVLQAIPSKELCTLAEEAIALGKLTELHYNVTSAALTVEQPDGRRETTQLEWNA